MVNGRPASASPYSNNYHIEDFLEREELNKKFKSLENLTDEELMNLCYKNFHEDANFPLVQSIASYLSYKALKESKKKTTSLEQNGPRT